MRQFSWKHLVLGGTLGVLTLFCSVPIYLVGVLIRPKKIPHFGDRTYTPFELELPAQAVTFPSRNGEHNVSGWLIPHPDATTTILVCPGYRTSKADLLGISLFLWRAGHTVLVFEYYGHGAEVGTPVTLGYREMEDFLGAVDYTKWHMPDTRIGVVAYSMGASIAIMCSAHTPDIEALVADSAFATHKSVIGYNIRRTLHIPSAPFLWLTDCILGWRAGYHFRQVEPLRDIARFSPRPILIIHGGADTIVDPYDAPLLYTAAQEPKELWMVPEADHCGAYFADRPVYVKRIVDFFAEHLKQQPARPRLVTFARAEGSRVIDRQKWYTVSRHAAGQEEHIA
jgi:fermentation-respiration switch protein FrsA (DUF1100 family)